MYYREMNSDIYMLKKHEQHNVYLKNSVQ